MVRHLLAATALMAGLSVAAWGEDATQQPGTDATVPPATAPQDQPQGGAMDTAQSAAPTDTSAVGRASPGEAVIATQPDTHLRAEELIGMSVVSSDGKSVGRVSDLILDDQQKLAGIVIGMGGFLGIGEKTIGVQWSQVQMRKDTESGKDRIFVNLTRDDLANAPDFKTKEQLKSEAEAAAAAAQSQSPMPAAGGGTTQ